MSLNKRETALILAGLRLLQRELARDVGLPQLVETILEDANMREVDLGRIDRLCEKVNS